MTLHMLTARLYSQNRIDLADELHTDGQGALRNHPAKLELKVSLPITLHTYKPFTEKNQP